MIMIRVIPAGTGRINNDPNATGANQAAKLGYFARLNYCFGRQIPIPG